MGGLQSYSGLTTKIREMQEKLFHPSDYQELASKSTVAEAVKVLEKHSAYREALSDIPEEKLHRAEIEAHLTHTEYADFTSIYLFANPEQRKYLQLYFTNFEAEFLRQCLRRAVAIHPEAIVYSEENLTFLKKYSHLDFKELLSARGLEQYVEATKSSKYYSVLHMLRNRHDENAAEYEAAIDMRHYRLLWEGAQKVFFGRDLLIFRETMGSSIDFMNFGLIHRAKKYYNMTPEEIYALIIPVRYRFRKNDIVRFVTAQNTAIMFAHLHRSEYGQHLRLATEDNYQDVMQKEKNRLYHESFARYPYTIACMNTYFYEKEREIRKIIQTLEQIRYREGKAPVKPDQATPLTKSEAIARQNEAQKLEEKGGSNR